MKRIFTKGFVVALATVMLFIVTGCDNKDVKELESRVETLETVTVESLKNQIQQMSTSLGQYKTTQDQLSGYVTNLQGRVSTLEGQNYAGLKSQVDDLKDRADAFDESLTNLQSYVDQKGGDLMQWVKDYYTTLELFNGLKSTVTGIETSITTIISRLNGLDETTAGIAQDLEEATGQLNTDLASCREDIDGLIGAIQDLAEALNSLYEDIQELIYAVQSVVVVPDYSDGSVKITDGEENVIRFEVYPLEAAENLADIGASAFSLDFVETEVKASALTNIPVSSVSFDEEFISIVVDGSNLPEEIKNGDKSANARLLISDGTVTRSSEYFQLCFAPAEVIPYVPTAVDLGIVINRGDGTAYKLLWAECNVGATAPEEGGDYYAWGETDYYYLDGHRYDNPLASWNYKDGKSSGYVEASYKWSGYSDMTVSKYCPTSDRWGGSGSPDGRTVLELDDDVARAVMGEGWRMPTPKEFEALAWWCDHEWTTINGVAGMKITSTVNGQSIFLPGVGYRSGNILQYNDSGQGYRGFYWTSSLNSKDALYGSIVTPNGENPEICFLPPTINTFYRYERCWGMQVRAVSTEETQPATSPHMGHEFVDMGNGIKMATMNIGAEYEDHPGDYFAWGEVSPKNDYSWGSYRYYDGSLLMTRYNETYSTGSGYEVINLYPEDDAAHVNWGGCWRTPTAAEWEILLDRSKYQWDWQEGGFRVTCLANNNSVFLPAAGIWDGQSRMNSGSATNYWAAGRFNGSNLRQISMLSGRYVPGFDPSVSMSACERRLGLPVRPVCDL